MISSGIRENTTLLEISLGDIQNIEKETVSSILTTLQLNKIVAGVIKSSNFSEHVSSKYFN
jgi:hypothetical protein